jgi:hypothetical protein
MTTTEEKFKAKIGEDIKTLEKMYAAMTIEEQVQCLVDKKRLEACKVQLKKAGLHD